ncbi:MAG: recombinase family protein [Halobacteriota archaeon]|nr:recombinase family protein [Halobacteriota archaeon]
MSHNGKDSELKKVGIYVRVSTEEQATSGISLDAQVEKLEQYCNLNGWDILRKYVDAGLSGSTIDRPELQKMIDDCRGGLINVILVYKLDRLSRSLRDIILTIDELREYGVDFVSLTEQIDTTTAVGQLMFHIIGAFAEFERNIIRERVIFGMDKKAKDGHVQYKAPFGYEYIDGKLIVDDEEAEIIKDIYIAYLVDKSTYKVAKKFSISQRQTHRILTNKTYLGKVKWKGEVIDGEHEAIIDQDTFNQVTEVMKNKRKK